MKAAFITETGPPSKITFGELTEAVPKATELLIEVGAVSVNPIDTYIRGGMIPMPLPLPFVVGCDFAGTIRSLGSEVRGFKVGDRVWGSNQGLLGRQGTFAERITVDQSFCYQTPQNCSDEDIAALALVCITAHLGLCQRALLRRGETLLVNGGAGGVGSAVIQIGKAMGAKVIATAGSDERAAICQSLGADVVINHKSEDVGAVVARKTAQGVDVFWETQRHPDFNASIDLLAENGRMVVMAGRDAQPPFPVGPFYVKGCSLHGFAMFKASAADQEKCAADIANWIENGHIRANIGKRFPLSEAAKAHELQEANTIHSAGTLHGKIVLTP